MTLIDVFHFPGHVFVDHVFASLSFYVIGLFYMCRGMQLIHPGYYWRTRNNRRRDRKIAIFMMMTGGLYAALHLTQMGVALYFSESQLVSLHTLYACLGLGFFLTGVLKHAFSKDSFVTKALNPSILIGLGSMGLALFFHPGFSAQTNSDAEAENYRFQNAVYTASWMYQTVAVFLFFIGLTDLLEQIQKEKWLLVQGFLWIGAAILFVISSEEIVKWMTLGAGVSIGMGPVVMGCMYFVGIHVSIFAWISRWKNRNIIEEVSSLNLKDYEEADDDEIPLEVHMPENDIPMAPLRNRRIPARPTFSLKNSGSDSINNISSSSSSSSSSNEESGKDDDNVVAVVLSKNEDDD